MNNRDLNKSATLCLVIGGGISVILLALLPWAIKDSLEAVTYICIFFGVLALPLLIIGIKLKLRAKQDYSARRVSFAETVSGGMQRYKVEWLWDCACEVYCRVNNKDPQMLDDKDNEEIYDLAGNDVALFLTWIIDQGFFAAEDEDIEKYCGEVKRRELTGSEFLDSVCDQKLSRSDFAQGILPFVDDYFYDDGAHKSGDFRKDYEYFIENDLKQELFTVKFSWEEYDAFAPYIDRAYQRFVSQNRQE